MIDIILIKNKYLYINQVLINKILTITKLLPGSHTSDILKILDFYFLLNQEYLPLLNENEIISYQINLQNLLKKVDKEIMLDLNNLEIKDLLYQLDYLIKLNYNSEDFFFDIFHNLETRMKKNLINPNYYYTILDIYFRCNFKKGEFLDFVNSKAIEDINRINISSLSNFMRILFSIDSKKIEILEKSEKIIVENLNNIDDISLSNIIFSYCNRDYPVTPLFSSLEEEIFVRLDKICKEKLYDLLIDVLYNFVYSGKSSKFITDIILNRILVDSRRIENLYNISVYKIFNVFKEKKIKYPMTKNFEYFLCVHIHEMDNSELNEIKNILLEINYQQSRFMKFFEECILLVDQNDKIDLVNKYLKENIIN